MWTSLACSSGYVIWEELEAKLSKKTLLLKLEHQELACALFFNQESWF